MCVCVCVCVWWWGVGSPRGKMPANSKATSSRKIGTTTTGSEPTLFVAKITRVC